MLDWRHWFNRRLRFADPLTHELGTLPELLARVPVRCGVMVTPEALEVLCDKYPQDVRAAYGPLRSQR